MSVLLYKELNIYKHIVNDVTISNEVFIKDSVGVWIAQWPLLQNSFKILYLQRVFVSLLQKWKSFRINIFVQEADCLVTRV